MKTKYFLSSLIIIGLIFNGVGFVIHSSADETNNPFDYWYAPDNSFGISEYKTINWTYFKNLITSHSSWNLIYKRYSYSDWTNGNQYMNINLIWNESGYYKITLTFDAIVDVYDARFVFDCNLYCLDYIEKTGNEVWFNISIPNTYEQYNLMFNYSDIASIPNIYFDKGKTDNMFWFYFGRQNIPAGVYVFDPTFGFTGTGSDLTILAITTEYFWSSYDAPDSDGTADNITIKTTNSWNQDINVQCAIYEYVSATNLGNLIAVTETKNGLTTNTEFIFNFSEPKPSLTSGTNYFLCVGCISDGYSGTCGIVRVNDGFSNGRTFKSYANGVTWDNPMTGENSADNHVYIYCSYTHGIWENTCPNSSDYTIANESIDVLIDVGFWNCSIYDYDGNNTYGNITCSNGNTTEWSNQPNGTKSLTLNILDYGINYTVWLNYSDVYGCEVFETFWFITEYEIVKLNITMVYPINNSEVVFLNNITFYFKGTGTIFYNITVNNGLNYTNGETTNDTFYVWNMIYYLIDGNYVIWLNASDGNTANKNYTFFFDIVNAESEGYLLFGSISFDDAQLSIFFTLVLFIFFFSTGYKENKRSGGVFIILSGFCLLSFEALTVLILSSFYVIPLLTPVSIFIILLGIRKWLFPVSGEKTKSEGE